MDYNAGTKANNCTRKVYCDRTTCYLHQPCEQAYTATRKSVADKEGEKKELKVETEHTDYISKQHFRDRLVDIRGDCVAATLGNCGSASLRERVFYPE